MEEATTSASLPIHRKMSELRTTLEREIRTDKERCDLKLGNLIHTIKSKAEETLTDTEKLRELKDCLRKLENELDQALAVKSGKEAKCKSVAEFLSTTAATIDQLGKTVEELRARKDRYAAIISQQLLDLQTLEEKSDQDLIESKSTEEAIAWYKRVLCFQIEGEEGLKFTFNKIDLENPDKEFSFTVRLDGEMYILVHCDPYVEDINPLIQDLNKTMDLFKFARVMREKFRVAAVNAEIKILGKRKEEGYGLVIPKDGKVQKVEPLAKGPKIQEETPHVAEEITS